VNSDAEIPPYMDFLKGTDWPAGIALPQPDSDPDGVFVQQIVVMPEPHTPRWHAVWAKSAYNDYEEYYGTKADVLAWARPRCGNIQVWNDELRDLQPLPPHEPEAAE
jgi:hypothetical protein